MTEEEKAIIKNLKDTFSEDMEKITFYEDGIAEIRNALNLIEKQAKEIERRTEQAKYFSKERNKKIVIIGSLKNKLNDSIPKDKIRKLEDMWNDNIWNATDEASKEKAEMIRDVYRGLLDE